MASFTPVRGTRNEINAVSMVDGQFLYETDQGDGNRIYADIIDSNGDPKRVQVGGERGDQNRLVYLKDVALTNPQNNDYLKYDSVNQKWVNDGTLNNKIKNLDNNGQIDGTNVKYDNTTDMTTKINSKISMPTGGTTGDSLVLGIGNVPEWKQIRINVVDNLSSTSATDALSANQGRNLNSSISNLTTVVNQKVDAPKNAGTSGQVLALDAVGNTIWKTVTGGGGSGSSDWSDVTNKPFDVVYDQSISANNADFDIQSQSISGGTSVNVLYLNDDKIYRPTDTDDIATNTDPNYIPVSVNKAGGGQEKKRISFSNLVDRIKNKIFKLSAVANGDFLRYDSTSQKWVNDSTVANKLYDIDDTTIIKNSVSNELEVPIDNNTIIVDSSDNKVKVSNNITTKLSKVDNKIDKPTSATEGQVLTYRNNEWVADDSQGGGGQFVIIAKGKSYEGQTVTATKGTKSKSAVITSGVARIPVDEGGVWTLTLSSGETFNTPNMTYYGEYEVALLPNGSTVTPTNDIQVWLNCAGLNKSYTTMSEVLADTNTLSALISNNNASDYLARSTTWASDICSNESAMTYIGLNDYCANKLLADSTWLTAICNSAYFKKVLNIKVPNLISNTGDDGGIASASSQWNDTSFPYLAFNGDTSKTQGWSANTENAGEWLNYEFPTAIKPYVFDYKSGNFIYNYTNNKALKAFKIQGSNDGTDYTDLTDEIECPDINLHSQVLLTKNLNVSYKHIRLYITQKTGTYAFNGVAVLQFYGREEA